MQKILLYYKFVPISDPQTMRLWQRALCEKLNLRGRILISKDGLNGTVGGELQDLKYYTREIKENPLFSDIVWKWSTGTREDFPKLLVRVRDEIVAFDAVDELKVTSEGVAGTAPHLRPGQLHELIKERGDEVIFYDGRNMFEAQIGRFKNAIIPNVRYTRDFVNDIENGEISEYKDRPIVTYCTGGIRCEVLSSLMKNRGYKEVYQLDGGIVKYGETFGSQGLWEGKLFVFDKRMNMSFGDWCEDIGVCYNCQKATSRLVNSDGPNRSLHVCCENCPTPKDQGDLSPEKELQKV